MGSNPTRVACEGFFTDAWKALNMQCYMYTHKIKINCLSPDARTNQPIIAEPAAIWDSSQPIVIGQARWSRG